MNFAYCRSLSGLALIAGLSFIPVSSLFAANTPPPFTLMSTSFKNSSTMQIQQAYTQAGGPNISPELYWTNPPAGVKSYALTVYDPDAGKGKGWWHWLQLGIPAATTQLPLGYGRRQVSEMDPGFVVCTNSFGNTGYSGPCPPAGDPPHHYIFTLYALNVAQLPPCSDSPPDVNKDIQAHSIGKAVLTGLYGR